MSIPIIDAASGSTDTARIALPVRVRHTKKLSAIMSTAVATMTTICTYSIVKLPIDERVEQLAGPVLSGRRSNVSYVRGFAPQSSAAVCSRKNETPSALISGAMRGALRSGR